jgi:hypothetical protein
MPLDDAAPEWDDTAWDMGVVLPEGPWPDEAACARWAMVERHLARPHRRGCRIWEEVNLVGEADDFVIALCARGDAAARAAERATLLWSRVLAWLWTDSAWARLRPVLEALGVLPSPDHDPLSPADRWLEVCPSHGPPGAGRSGSLVGLAHVVMTGGP